MYTQILKFFESYQNEIEKHYSRNITCSKGCSYCCFHWVEDVYSFEVEQIIEFLKHGHKNEIPSMIAQLKEDENALIDLDNIVEERLQSLNLSNSLDENDRIDLLLASYYQLKRPCPLLNKNGSCKIYHIRPITCRIYVSFFNPDFCKPERIDHEDSKTYLLDFQENASELLDKIHFKYIRYKDDTGLRSLLLKYLQDLH